MMFRLSSLRPWIATLLAVCVFGAHASDDEVAPFIGNFSGQSVADSSRLLTPRDLDIRIKQTSNGFLIDWHSAVTEQGAPERLNHEVLFERSRAPYVYRAHRSPNVFGSARAPDPIDGRPYYWARVSGGELVIYVMQIMTDGTVDFRIYERRLNGEQLHLRFTRLRDGWPVEVVSGTLARDEG